MTRRTTPVHGALVLLCVLLMSCSPQAGSPLLPSTDTTGASIPTANEQALLGLYEIVIDARSETVEVVPLRGADFQVNVVRFLHPPSGNPANIGVSINKGGTDVKQGLIDMNVSITHPFPGTNVRGFDVRGIVLSEKGTQLSKHDHDVQYPKQSETRLLNADGYTRWWNAVEFVTPGLFGYTPGKLGNTVPKATVNGYKYFCDDLDADDPLELNIHTRGTFSTENAIGDPNKLTRQYILKFPVIGGMPKVKFNYAICASFAPPLPGNPPPAPVDAYPIRANCPEAYQISVSIAPSNTAWYMPGGAGGDLVLNVEVYDWQTMENSDGIDGEVSGIFLESTTLFDGVVDVLANATSQAPSGETSSVWTVEIDDVNPTDALQEFFITVESTSPNSYAPPTPGAGIYPGGAKLSAYMLANIEIPGNSAPQIGSIYGPDKYTDGATLIYKLTGASDMQDGPNLTIKWDFDSDGIFDDDEDGFENNLKGIYTFTGEDIYHVRCRVYDTAMAHTDSNILAVEPITLPYIDPMDNTTQTRWTVQNGLFGTHTASIQWNIQGDLWAASSPSNGYYQNYMDTTLISPVLPTGSAEGISVLLEHRYDTEKYFDHCDLYYRKNNGSWLFLDGDLSGKSSGWPDYVQNVSVIDGLTEGDTLELGLNFNSDAFGSNYGGWDITNVVVTENLPPEITEIKGPGEVGSLGPWSYSVVVDDIDGINSYFWSVEEAGMPVNYDDSGDGGGIIDITFPGDGFFDINVKVTDKGDPPLNAYFGPYTVTVITLNPDAFFHDHFSADSGIWTYTGGIDDGSYQDFWHIDTANSHLSNVGPDGCYAESDTVPIEKTASAQVTFPSSTDSAMFKILHRLDVESYGYDDKPYDGQWVTIDGTVVNPTTGFLYSDDGGNWLHGYFVGYSGGWVVSTFDLGAIYNDGASHTLTLHQLSTDTYTNCSGGWQVDYMEFWIEG